MTPEGKVKAAISRVLVKYGVYKFMPVQTGYGARTIDFLVCINGIFVAIEAKAPGEEPTAIQNNTIKQITDAGGVVFVIDNAKGTGALETFLEKAVHAPCASKF